MSNLTFPLMLAWIFSIGILAVIGYAVFEEYNKCKNRGEEELHGFWRNLTIVAIVVAVGTVGFILYLESGKSHRNYHDMNGNEQIQYQGSQEQMKDLNDIDRYSNSHSNF